MMSEDLCVFFIGIYTGFALIPAKALPKIKDETPVKAKYYKIYSITLTTS